MVNTLVVINEVTLRQARSYSTPGPVSTWMGDRLRTGKPSRYVTSHPGQLSLAIPPWVGAMSTSESWEVNSHTTRYTIAPYPWSRNVSWCLAEAKETEISAALWALWLGKDFTFFTFTIFDHIV